MAREARTLEEEQGINVLYLALGFLHWFEDESSSVDRQAPLILVPAILFPQRPHLAIRTDVSQGDDILTKRTAEAAALRMISASSCRRSQRTMNGRPRAILGEGRSSRQRADSRWSVEKRMACSWASSPSPSCRW